jgi:trimeric autotransporter adhesin
VNNGVIIGGAFTQAAGVPASRIVLKTENGWEPFGSGVGGPTDPIVLAVEVMPNTDVIAGGHFTLAGGIAATNVARWDGGSWHALGEGLDSTTTPGGVRALAALPSGELIAGGNFDVSGSNIVKHIAKWNGTAWDPIGGGMNADVYALAIAPGGDLYAGGAFSMAGSKPAVRIARWDGTVWSPLGSGLGFFGDVHSITAIPNGDIIVGGLFEKAGNVFTKGIARWDGSSWFALGGGLSSIDGSYPIVRSLVALPNGSILAAGSFDKAGSTLTNSVALWDGSLWHALQSGINVGEKATVYAAAALQSGELVFGGDFYRAGDTYSTYFARFACPPKVCIPDCDGSKALDIDDFVCFQTLYAIGDPLADCDADGTLNLDDFVCFLTIFALGC